MVWTRLLRSRRGAALLEFSLLSAGIALVAAVGIAILGHKTTDLIASVAAIAPGAHADDNGPIASGRIIQTAPASSGQITLAPEGFNGPRLGNNLGLNNLEALVLEP